MLGNRAFWTTYVALIALTWNTLERIDCRLVSGSDGDDWQDLQTDLQIVRLELLQLADKSRDCAGTMLLSSDHNVVMQRFVAKLLAWLDVDTEATPDVLAMRLGAAQNWLFDEACNHAWNHERQNTRLSYG